MANSTNHPPRGRKRLKFCAVCERPFEVALCDLERRLTCSRKCATKRRNAGKGAKQAYACACGCGRILMRCPSQVPGENVYHSRAAAIAAQKGKPRKTVGRKKRPKPLSDPEAMPRTRAAGAWVGMAKVLKVPTGRKTTGRGKSAKP